MSPLKNNRCNKKQPFCLPFSAHPEDTMPEVKSILREVLPKQGQLYMEDVPTMVLCKPKLLPLKSVTLEKLEKMQMEAQEAVKQQELAMKEQVQHMPS
uniref:BBSome interacting protein 1 n=2 Tax=Fundulus heteroclitus TaxID=8078 RepID=A0A3Q2PH61_FUNHE